MPLSLLLLACALSPGAAPQETPARCSLPPAGAAEAIPHLLDTAIQCVREDRLVEALEAQRRLHQSYGKSRSPKTRERARRALFELGERLETATFWAQSAKTYELFTGWYPKTPLAREALERAITLRRALEQYDAVVANLKLHARRYGPPARDHLEIILTRQAQGAFDRVSSLTLRYLKRSHRLPPDLRLRALVARAGALARLGKPGDAASVYETAVSYAQSLSLAQRADLPLSARSAIAAAQLGRARAVLDEAAAIPLYGRDREAQRRITQRLQLVTRGAQMLDEIHSHASPEWSVAASIEQGRAFAALEEALVNYNPGTGCRYDCREMLEDVLSHLVDAARKHADDAYRQAHELASQTPPGGKHLAAVTHALALRDPQHPTLLPEARLAPSAATPCSAAPRFVAPPS